MTGAAADARLEALVRSSDRLMGVLRAARVGHYRRRLRDKRVAERWPRVTIVDP